MQPWKLPTTLGVIVVSVATLAATLVMALVAVSIQVGFFTLALPENLQRVQLLLIDRDIAIPQFAPLALESGAWLLTFMVVILVLRGQPYGRWHRAMWYIGVAVAVINGIHITQMTDDVLIGLSFGGFSILGPALVHLYVQFMQQVRHGLTVVQALGETVNGIMRVLRSIAAALRVMVRVVLAVVFHPGAVVTFLSDWAASPDLTARQVWLSATAAHRARSHLRLRRLAQSVREGSVDPGPAPVTVAAAVAALGLAAAVAWTSENGWVVAAVAGAGCAVCTLAWLLTRTRARRARPTVHDERGRQLELPLVSVRAPRSATGQSGVHGGDSDSGARAADEPRADEPRAGGPRPPGGVLTLDERAADDSGHDEVHGASGAGEAIVQEFAAQLHDEDSLAAHLDKLAADFVHGAHDLRPSTHEHARDQDTASGEGVHPAVPDETERASRADRARPSKTGSERAHDRERAAGGVGDHANERSPEHVVEPDAARADEHRAVEPWAVEAGHERAPQADQRAGDRHDERADTRREVRSNPPSDARKSGGAGERSGGGGLRREGGVGRRKSVARASGADGGSRGTAGPGARIRQHFETCLRRGLDVAAINRADVARQLELDDSTVRRVWNQCLAESSGREG